MADLIQKNNEPSAPEPNNSGGKITAVIFLIVAVLCGLFFVGTHSVIALVIGALSLFISFIAFVSGITFSGYTPESKRYGDAGERRTGTILERYLPDSYTVIQNVHVTYNGKSSEIDNIIIGKSGVFVVEVKNVKGTVTGNFEDQKWHQDKIDRYDIEHEKEFYNPVKQVGTHIYRLANYLRDNKIFTRISGAVYFANPQTGVYVDGEPKDIPVFTYRSTQALLDYIESGTASLSENTIKKIVQLLQ